jgi:hypothetical protein
MADEIRDLLDNLAHGMPSEERATLDVGGRHPYACKCETCCQWWKLCGPEEAGTEEEHYGPFTKAEVEAP